MTRDEVAHEVGLDVFGEAVEQSDACRFVAEPARQAAFPPRAVARAPVAHLRAALGERFAGSDRRAGEEFLKARVALALVVSSSGCRERVDDRFVERDGGRDAKCLSGDVVLVVLEQDLASRKLPFVVVEAGRIILCCDEHAFEMRIREHHVRPAVQGSSGRSERRVRLRELHEGALDGIRVGDEQLGIILLGDLEVREEILGDSRLGEDPRMQA